jgi:hypothetical protein
VRWWGLVELDSELWPLVAPDDEVEMALQREAPLLERARLLIDLDDVGDALLKREPGAPPLAHAE